jgi:hypothetical protein
MDGVAYLYKRHAGAPEIAVSAFIAAGVRVQKIVKHWRGIGKMPAMESNHPAAWKGDEAQCLAG